MNWQVEMKLSGSRQQHLMMLTPDIKQNHTLKVCYTSLPCKKIMLRAAARRNQTLISIPPPKKKGGILGQPIAMRDKNEWQQVHRRPFKTLQGQAFIYSFILIHEWPFVKKQKNYIIDNL